MSKFKQGGKLSMALLLAFSMLIQIVVPSVLSVTYAMEDEEDVGMEVTVGQDVEEVSEETTEEPEVEIEAELDTVESAGEEIISEESDEEEIVTEEEVEEKPVAKVVQVEARNSNSGFFGLDPSYDESNGEFQIRFQYDLNKVKPGDEFIVQIDEDYIDLEELQDGVSYTVIKDGSTYKIKFKDEFSGANQGIISIKTQTKEVDKSDEYKIEWKLDDENFFETIFIKKPGDSESDIRGEKSSKNVQSNWELGNKIKGEVNEDGEQFITVEDDITSKA